MTWVGTEILHFNKHPDAAAADDDIDSHILSGRNLNIQLRYLENFWW